jgi:hypothetical protein
MDMWNEEKKVAASEEQKCMVNEVEGGRRRDGSTWCNET